MGAGAGPSPPMGQKYLQRRGAVGKPRRAAMGARATPTLRVDLADFFPRGERRVARGPTSTLHPNLIILNASTPGPP